LPTRITPIDRVVQCPNYQESVMPDINKMINDPAVSDPAIMDNQLDLEDWSRQQGESAAREEGIVMTEEHWQVVDFLRDYYLRHGNSSNGREVAEALDAAFESRGGGAYLHGLFPKGPVAQGCRIGGVPMPSYTEDASFGSAM
jgi:TusE/DsrC/DsvC family sulfur relay protein